MKSKITKVLLVILAVAVCITIVALALRNVYYKRGLDFRDNYTITAHTGAFDTEDNSIEYVKAAIANNVDILEIDVRCRPDGTIAIGHDELASNSDGVLVSDVFDLVKPTSIRINLDIKEDESLAELQRLIEKYDMFDQVFLTGIKLEDVEYVKRDCQGVSYYVNYPPSKLKIKSEKYQQEYLNVIKETGAIGINCNHKDGSKTLSELLHNNGYLLSLWTVDDEKNLKRVLLFAPDNITTHNPDMVKAAIDNMDN